MDKAVAVLEKKARIEALRLQLQATQIFEPGTVEYTKA
eukprot:CAMPEP_0117649790 /NCGR_PEP_ID=MMETSP0804-20121206/1182_1 /TAXON_ID=1074897 /ORGANISM="Tetraselmis astigmatica, Strain CCMP880" /LENGTH=37 /DNA_ID= /DNA_START= /DNA_END= /DNA_ORIENTATION=